MTAADFLTDSFMFLESQDLPHGPPYAADETPTVRIMVNFETEVCSGSD
jgi:hypothetical protein